MGRDWRAYLIVNLSVCAGRYHPAPDADVSRISFEVSSLRVRRTGYTAVAQAS